MTAYKYFWGREENTSATFKIKCFRSPKNERFRKNDI